MSEVQTISTIELHGRLKRGGALHFWNVLTDKYFTGELIPGSRHVPLDRLGREVSQGNIPKAAEIIVYCSGPTCPMSAIAARKLMTLGHTNVRAYEGGVKEWANAGLRIEGLAVA